ncbi:MAG TPA: UDP-N-acetylmuramoyl-tripeptide--D-alanyl-D-alanine ligase [Candidatus Limnocylindria bacterium]|nr:UDP-N-acetylmuramoyl-tripeptide--D-alanyl-D-alanine ligase [Candidatus Limnocylindria bacterium]
MKRVAKTCIVAILGWQVRRLRRKADFKVVAVAGSIGKTSTKFAIAAVVGQQYKVHFQAGNYNDVVSVPLVFFGLPIPSLLNPLAWAATFIKIEKQLRSAYPHDVVVVEAGTDFPGNLAQFKQYLQADIGVLTAITPEHMEFFADLDAVAEEELTIADLSERLLVNADLCDEKYLKGLSTFTTYGRHDQASYRLEQLKHTPEGYAFTITKAGRAFLQEKHASPAEAQLASICAAVTVGDMLGMDRELIRKGIETIKPVSGRMQRLKGIKNSILLDDTYNASPEAAKAALDTVYKLDAPQKIALLGNMNELGAYSREAHQEIGAYCDPAQLDLVVALGPDANEHLAAAAEARGCKVVRTETPLKAADEIIKVLQKDAVVLAKGSQNGVFAEEAVKKLLADPRDAKELVRQSPYWIKQKQKWLGDLDAKD